MNNNIVLYYYCVHTQRTYGSTVDQHARSHTDWTTGERLGSYSHERTAHFTVARLRYDCAAARWRRRRRTVQMIACRTCRRDCKRLRGGARARRRTDDDDDDETHTRARQLTRPCACVCVYTVVYAVCVKSTCEWRDGVCVAVPRNRRR